MGACQCRTSVEVQLGDEKKNIAKKLGTLSRTRTYNLQDKESAGNVRFWSFARCSSRVELANNLLIICSYVQGSTIAMNNNFITENRGKFEDHYTLGKVLDDSTENS